MTIADAVIAVVERHPAIQRARLVGSRAAGTANAFSDWDFAVETDDFPVVQRDIDVLLAPLTPIAQQWDPLSDTWCRMVILRGPSKLDFIFAERHAREPPWQASAATLDAIDRHFWDWALWLRSKQESCRADLVRSELDKMFVHILHPIGVESSPASLAAAVHSYLVALDRLESTFGASVSRELRREIESALDA